MNKFIIEKFKTDENKILECPNGIVPVESHLINRQQMYYAKFETIVCKECSKVKECCAYPQGKYYIVREQKAEIRKQNELAKQKGSSNKSDILEELSRYEDMAGTDAAIDLVQNMFGTRGGIKGYKKMYDGNILTYAGEVEGDICHGKGRYYYPNGQVEYDGNFYRGYLRGKGVYYYENGNKRWDGIFEPVVGLGSKYYEIIKDSYSYADTVGRIVKGKAYREEDGSLEYEGEFKLGVPNGIGCLYDKTGNVVFKGIFKEGKGVQEDISPGVREVIGTYEDAEFRMKDLRDISPYSIYNGISEMLLHYMFLLKNQFLKKQSRILLINTYLEEIKFFTEGINTTGNNQIIQKRYVDFIDETVQSAKSWGINKEGQIWNEKEWDNFFRLNRVEMAKKISVSDTEVMILWYWNKIVIQIEKLFAKLLGLDNPLIAYYQIIVLLDVGKDIIQNTSKYISPNDLPRKVILYLNTEYEVVTYELKGNIDEGKEFFEFEQYKEELNNGLYLKDIYKRLTKKGRVLFSTGEYFYENVNYLDDEEIDYWPAISSYIKCIECELRERIGNNLIEKIPQLNTPLTLGSFKFCFNKYLDIVSGITGEVIRPRTLEQFQWLIELRNNNTHDNILNREQYMEVRKVLIEDGLLNTIVDIKPLEKSILEDDKYEEVKNKIASTFVLNQCLHSCIEYYTIDPVTSANNVELGNKVIVLLEKVFNHPFSTQVSVVKRKIQFELELDYICCSIKDIDSRKLIKIMWLRYAGVRKIDNGFSVLLRIKLEETDRELGMEIKFIDQGERTVVIFDDNSQLFRSQLYKGLYNRVENKSMSNKYIQFIKGECAYLLKYVMHMQTVNECIERILISKEVWGVEEQTLAVINIINELLLYVYAHTELEGKDKRTIIKACIYIATNMDIYFDDNNVYKYPYAVIKINSQEEIINVEFEKIRLNKKEKTIFEIVEV